MDQCWVWRSYFHHGEGTQSVLAINGLEKWGLGELERPQVVEEMKDILVLKKKGKGRTQSCSWLQCGGI